MRTGFGWLVATGMLVALPALAAAPTPMVDGDCGEYAALGAQRETIVDGVTLHVHQDRDHVWLCYTVPDGSFGLLDLRIESDALPEPVNVHVSAKLGEWPADRPELAPQGPDSPLWWNHRGWTAHWIAYDGVDRDAAPPRPRWRLGGAREVQLFRARFGAGEWRLAFDIQRIRGADGTDSNVRFPAGDALYRLQPLRSGDG